MATPRDPDEFPETMRDVYRRTMGVEHPLQGGPGYGRRNPSMAIRLREAVFGRVDPIALALYKLLYRKPYGG
jgi:hypothetical protein